MDAISINSDEGTPDNYESVDVSPSYAPKNWHTRTAQELPEELHTADAHADRSPDSYDIDLGVVTHERRNVNDSLEDGSGDIQTE